MNLRRALPLLLGVIITGFAAPAARAWDAHGHRLVTLLALDAIRSDQAIPAWLQEDSVRARLAFQAAEPDRWRGQGTIYLRHENNPDHYMDVEDLADFDLTLRTVPPLRYEFVRAMSLAKAAHPERFTRPWDPAKDPAKEQEWPGFVCHAIAEHYAKLQASFRTLKILESLGEPSRAAQIEQEKANVIYHLGALSHFVGDSAQPLHTTRHHHGWIGDNPRGYTTDYGFHSYIDGKILSIHGIDYRALKDLPRPERTVNEADPWGDIVAELERSFAQVEPLYAMQKDGSLAGPAGKALITERFLDASSILAALVRNAWATSDPTGRDIELFKVWTPAAPDGPPPPLPPALPPAPASAPAPQSAVPPQPKP